MCVEWRSQVVWAMKSLHIGQETMTKLTSNHDDKPKSKFFKTIFRFHLRSFSRNPGQTHHKLRDEETQQRVHDEERSGASSSWVCPELARIPKTALCSLWINTGQTPTGDRGREVRGIKETHLWKIMRRPFLADNVLILIVGHCYDFQGSFCFMAKVKFHSGCLFLSWFDFFQFSLVCFIHVMDMNTPESSSLSVA